MEKGLRLGAECLDSRLNVLFSWMEYVFHLGVGVLSRADVVTGQQSWQITAVFIDILSFVSLAQVCNSLTFGS